MSEQKSFSMHPAIPADTVKPINLDFSSPFAPQITGYFDNLEDIRGTKGTGLPGQAVAAALTLPVLEMATGLPTMYLFGFGKDIKVVGELDLSDFRHNQVRSRRSESPDGEAFAGYTILDGAGRGVESFQLQEIAENLNTTTDNIRVVDVSMGHIDPADPAKGLVDRLIGTGLTRADWTSGRLLFLPPGFGPLSIVMSVAIYGLTEVWPRAIRFNREDDGTFHVAEIVDPQSLRQFGVKLQAKWEAGNAPVSVPRDTFNQILNVLDQYGEHAFRKTLEALTK